MLKQYTRPLNDKEKGYLRKIIDFRKRDIASSKRTSFFFIAVFIGVMMIVSYSESGNIDLNFVLFALAVSFPPVYIYTYFSIRLLKKSIQSAETEFRNDKVEVIHCKSNQLLILESETDLSPQYMFQVEPNKILCLSGQFFQFAKKFPNNDFELAQSSAFPGSYHFPQVCELYIYGEKLKPIYTISQENRDKMPPEIAYTISETILDGKIEDFKKFA